MGYRNNVFIVENKEKIEKRKKKFRNAFIPTSW